MLAETDYRGAGDLPLEFVRYYNSAGIHSRVGAARDTTVLGQFWHHTYQRQISVEAATTPQITIAYAIRPDGEFRRFTQSGTNWVAATDSPERLSQLNDNQGVQIGWMYAMADDAVEIYDVNGKLLSVTNRSGRMQSLTYSTASTPPSIAPVPGLLIQVTDDFGRSLQLLYNTDSSLSHMIDPAGNAYGYRYDTTAQFAYVDYPSSGTRQYPNNENDHAGKYGIHEPGLVTGIIDENQQRYATYEYQAWGGVMGVSTASWHGSANADKVTLTYSSYTGATSYTSVTDALGNLKTINFITINGNLKDAGVSQCRAAGCPASITTNITYDTAGYLKSKKDFNGVVTNYTYDDTRGLEMQRIEASGKPSQRTVKFVWNTSFRVPDLRSVVNSSGVIEALTKWSYNPRGQALSRCVIDPAVGSASGYTCGSSTNAPTGVRQSTYTYCEQADISAGTCPLIGLVTSANGPRQTTGTGMGGLDDTITYVYYPTDDATCASNGACPHRHGDLWKVTNALGQITEYVTYDKNGRVTRMKDANGTYTDMVYHPRGWLTDRIVYANATGTAGAGDATMHIDYDAVGNVTKVTQPDGAFLAYAYDDAHRLTKISDNLNNAIDYCPGGVGNAECLDAAGNRKVEQVRDPSGNIKRSLHRVYNQLSQLTQVLNAASLPVERSDALNSTIGGLAIKDGYDPNGNRVLSQDGLNVKTEQDYDPLNRLKTTIQNLGGADLATKNTTTGYVYDTRDNLRTVVDPDSLSTTYDYDGLNNLTGLHSPDTGFSQYTPDAAGNRISQTDNRGQVSTYTYDALNRLTAIAYVGASALNVGYAYDQADGTTGCTGSFPQGRLTTMTDASGSTTYCYDRHGNVTRKTQLTGSTALATQYTYNVADRLATMTYPSGAIVTYGRDVLGRVQTVDWQANAGASAISLVGGATYYPFGPLNTLTFGNGRMQSRTYDQDYAIDSIAGTPSDALTLELAVDVMGNIINASGTLSPTMPDRGYLYDPLYRLTAAQTGALPPGPLETYTYDKTGDRMSAALNGGAAQTYAYTPLTHHLASVGGTARTYDLNGNTQTGTATGLTLGYDARNRLSTAVQGNASAAYGYNGRGERVSKQYQPPLGQLTLTPYAYDEAGRLLGDYATATTEYIYLDSIPVAVIKAGVPYYIETDHLGTPRQVIDRTRNVAVWKWDSLASTFGTNAPEQDPDGDSAQFVMNLRFPGQYFDAETGLDYNYFRDYEPGTGRYVESDPIGLRGGVNTYTYARSNPLRAIDYRGLSVRWTGSQWSVGATAAFGGQLSFYELVSECKCNKKYRVRGYASFLTIGGGAELGTSQIGDLGGSGDSLNMEDPAADCPDADAPNGAAWYGGISIVPIGGGTLLQTWGLGRLRSHELVSGPSIGLDLSIVATVVGASYVYDVQPIECCSGK